MLELYFGTDAAAARQAALAAVAAAVAAGARLIPVEVAHSQALLEEMVGSVSLFGESLVYFLDTPSADDTFARQLAALLPDVAASRNTVVVVEGALLAADKKRWQKAATVMEEFVATATMPAFDTFALADALARRDKKQLWLLYTAATTRGLSAEELIGILWWQLKTLRLAAMTSSAAAAGLKEFPYSKAKRALSAFKKGELEQLARSLLLVYHDGHGGRRDIASGLEAWILTV